MRQRVNSESGWTLVEVIIFLVVAVFLLIVIGKVFTVSLHSWQLGSRQAEAQQTARMALDTMVRELRGAVKIEAHNTPDELFFIEPAQHTRVSFYKHAGILYRKSSVPQPIAGVTNQLFVTGLIFCVSPDGKAVDIELTVAWRDWCGAEKLENVKTTVYCVNSMPEK